VVARPHLHGAGALIRARLARHHQLLAGRQPAHQLRHRAALRYATGAKGYGDSVNPTFINCAFFWKLIWFFGFLEIRKSF
jgi:hypothetical protein